MVRDHFPEKEIVAYIPAKNEIRGAALELRAEAHKNKTLPLDLRRAPASGFHRSGRRSNRKQTCHLVARHPNRPRFRDRETQPWGTANNFPLLRGNFGHNMPLPGVRAGCQPGWRRAIMAAFARFHPSLDRSTMSDPFDPYREALVVETATVWPEELSQPGPAEREAIERASARRSGPGRRAGICPPLRRASAGKSP